MRIPTLRINGVPEAIACAMPGSDLVLLIRVPTVEHVSFLGDCQTRRALNEAVPYAAEHLLLGFDGVTDQAGNPAANTLETRVDLLNYLPIWLFFSAQVNRLSGWLDEGNAGSGSVS